MKKEKIVILGGGDTARKTIDIIKRDKLFNIVGYYNIKNTLKKIKFLGNFSKFYKENFDSEKVNFVPALGGRADLLKVRTNFIKVIIKKKLKTPKIISRRASIHKRAKIEKGTIIFDNVFVDLEVKIGAFSFINIGSTICHDAILGKNVIISPKTLIDGRCILKDNIFVGSNVVINPKVKVAENVIIGSQSNVLRDIKKKGLYFGNPVKKIR
tara:strand:- start:445 stop:1080 length:636 start_codon:yes stop_codon:yes gene_type:complete